MWCISRITITETTFKAEAWEIEIIPDQSFISSFEGGKKQTKKHVMFTIPRWIVEINQNYYDKTSSERMLDESGVSPQPVFEPMTLEP